MSLTQNNIESLELANERRENRGTFIPVRYLPLWKLCPGGTEYATFYRIMLLSFLFSLPLQEGMRKKQYVWIYAISYINRPFGSVKSWKFVPRFYIPVFYIIFSIIVKFLAWTFKILIHFQVIRIQNIGRSKCDWSETLI